MNRAILLTAVLTAVAGCNSTWTKSVNSKMPWAEKEPKLIESEFDRPTRIVAIWSDAILNQPGSPPIRGFGGRIYFYNAHNKAVPVEGQLVVYGYDDTDEQKRNVEQPDKTFAFPAEHLKGKFSPTELGASYSIWLPWEPAGGYKKTISLLPKFLGSDGTIVMGQQSINILPGKSLPQEAEQAQVTERGRFLEVPREQKAPVRQVSYQQETIVSQPEEGTWQMARGNDQQPRMRTSTITLPMTMQKRLLQNADAAGTAVVAEHQPREAKAMRSQRPRVAAPAAAPETLPANLPAAASVQAAGQAPSNRSALPTRPAPTRAAWPATAGRPPNRQRPTGWQSLPGYRPTPNPSPAPAGYGQNDPRAH